MPFLCVCSFCWFDCWYLDFSTYVFIVWYLLIDLGLFIVIALCSDNLMFGWLFFVVWCCVYLFACLLRLLFDYVRYCFVGGLLLYNSVACLNLLDLLLLVLNCVFLSVNLFVWIWVVWLVCFWGFSLCLLVGIMNCVGFGLYCFVWCLLWFSLGFGLVFYLPWIFGFGFEFCLVRCLGVCCFGVFWVCFMMFGLCKVVFGLVVWCF